MQKLIKVTVFTPTHNRGYIIANAYNSLCRQTCKDFEWIVVDDGSTDNTEELFAQWMTADNGFPIYYKKVTNGGKQRAANLGAKLAKGELFLNLDSDDYLTDDAIETVIKWESTISSKKEQFAGVAGCRCHFDNSLIGETFEGEFLDASTLDRDRYNINGDKVEIFYTELLRKYPFQEFDGEKFIAEGVVWMEICFYEKKVLRWFNKAIYCCEYLNDGYSAHALQLSIQNPKGILYNSLKIIEMTEPNYLGKLKLWHKYYVVAKKNGYKNVKIRSDLKISRFDYTMLKLGHSLAQIRNKVFRWKIK